MTRKIAITFVLFLLLVCATFAADVYYPYGNVSLNLPPTDDPFPGFGSYYSALDSGMRTALWNPAGLGKLKLSEASIFFSTTPGLTNVNKTSNVTEPSGTFEVGAGVNGAKATMDYAVFFRPYSAVQGIGVTTKEVQIQSNLNYTSSSTGINFSAAQRVNDWLVVGFASRNPVDGDISLAGNFPLTGRMLTSLPGKSMGDMQITNDGKLKFTFNSGGITTTPETVTQLWNGFLTQEATFPFTAVSELRDNLNVQSPYIATVASQYKNLYAGFNFIPINASAQIDNDIRSVVNSDVPDQTIYVPNFDPNNATSGGNWIADPDQYGTKAGYASKQIALPSGELIADAKYRGFYNGSSSRIDFGMMYDISKWFSIGLAMENINGATITMQGNGIATYYSYRDVNTGEANTLFQPGTSSTWNIFSNQWITSGEAGDSALHLDPSFTYAIPKKTRIGFVFKPSFVIAVDYEMNNTPIIFNTALNGGAQTGEVRVSDLSFLRVGTEGSIWAVKLKSGLTFILKPTISGAGIDQKTQDNINKDFQFGVLPIKLDLGVDFNFWSYEITSSLGINGMSLINLAQFDVDNLDLSKTFFMNLALTKDVWQFTYLYEIDPLSTFAAIRNEPADANGNKNFSGADLKFIHTLGVTYHF